MLQVSRQVDWDVDVQVTTRRTAHPLHGLSATRPGRSGQGNQLHQQKPPELRTAIQP